MGDIFEMVHVGQDSVTTPQKATLPPGPNTTGDPTTTRSPDTMRTSATTRSSRGHTHGIRTFLSKHLRRCSFPSCCMCGQIFTHETERPGKSGRNSMSSRSARTRSALERTTQSKKRSSRWLVNVKQVRCRRTKTKDNEEMWDISVGWDKIRKEKEKVATKSGQGVNRANSMKKRRESEPAVKDCDISYKVLLIGDSGVGKTALARALTGRDFRPKSLTTVGMDFVNRSVDVDGARIKLQVWDTAGQERFRSMTRFQFRGTQGAILAYDIADKESFKTLKYWLQLIDSEIDQHCKEPIPVFLIGNKSDITEKRQVSYKRGKQLAEEHLMRGYIETSAKTGKNVDEAFTQLAQAIVEIHHPKLLDAYLDKLERQEKYEQKQKEAEAIAQRHLQKQQSRIKLPTRISRFKSLEAAQKKCCIQ